LAVGRDGSGSSFDRGPRLETEHAAWLARRQDARIVLRRITSGGELREVTLPGRPGTRAEQVATDFFTD